MATPVGDSIPQSSDPRINGLVQGGSWQGGEGTVNLTWSAHAFNAGELTGAWMTMFSQTLNAWAAVANITFTQAVGAPVDDYASPLAGDIAITLVGQSDDAYAAAVFPDEEAGDLYLDGWSNRTEYPRPEGDIDVYHIANPAFVGQGLAPGGLGFSTLLHEIGHALGLKHPHDDGLNGRPLLTGTGPNGIPYDDGFWTVMSYEDPYLFTVTEGKQSTPMPLDILAIQYIYGANMNYRTGNDTYLIQDDHIVKTIWDAGGIDTFSVANSVRGVVMNLTAGSFINMSNAAVGSHTAIAYNVTIENAIGSAFNDTITGNIAANSLSGGDGNDSLNGGSGNDSLNGGLGVDTLTGGVGDDTFYVDRAGDAISEGVGQGTDTVNASASYSIAAMANVENLTLTGSAAINATGNALNNILRGNAGANVLAGGGGNDTYYVAAGDRVTENVGAGTDTVVSSTISYNLQLYAANVETLLLGGTAVLNATGNTINNTLRGNIANNVLNGLAGADSMIGMAGNDTYYLDNLGDTVTELFNEGTDTVSSAVSVNALWGSVENLILTGAAVSGNGNGLNNVITGSGIVNTLNGLAGNDRLNGGLGSDVLNGGAGADQFLFATALGATNVDVLDFALEDLIMLDNDIFGALGVLGTLGAAQLRIGAAATTAAHRIIYNSTTGNLFYDADGSGAGAQVLFADFAGGLALTNADFSVID